MPQKVVRSKRSYRPTKLPIFILLLLIIAVIGILIYMYIAFAKQRAEVGNSFSIPEPPVTVVSQPETDTSSNTSSSTSSNTSSGSSDTSSSSSANSDTATDAIYQRVRFLGTTVPETKPVGDDYFENAIFIGDSISKGLKLYGVIPEKNVIADQNVGLDQIYLDKDVYYISATQKTTLWKAIEHTGINPDKIYVLLGANGVPGFENDKHITYYYDLIDKLKAKYPDAIIYVESLTPITKATSDRRAPAFTKTKIDNFNELVLKMAEEKGLYYLNIQEVLENENGYLLDDYDGGDGTHMPKAGHQAVYEYFKTHTVSADGYVEVRTENE